MFEKTNRKNHPNFLKYQEDIVKHANYSGLHFKRKANNEIIWVAPKKTADGKLRDIWWRKKADELGITQQAGFYRKVALEIHPTKIHICQICGKGLSIQYVYPNSRTLKKINEIFDTDFKPHEKSILEILNTIPNQLESWKKIFKIKKSHSIVTYELLKEWLRENQIEKDSKSFFSPGVMSNAPDRFDGFHSDGKCCRSKSDKGRHKSNLQRYGQDRRVYENWADGDWKQADRLMSMFRKHGLSADHIGPISLGFCHRPKFHPMTKEENSAKNNRMSLNDVKVLIKDEKNGEQVVSWHSKYIWDNLKNKVADDKDAVKLSSLMRQNLHWVLTVFALIDENGYRDFLMQFLNLHYSDFDYRFPDFQPDGTFSEIRKMERKGKNQQNNKERYIRIAFESLENYKNIENRRVSLWTSQFAHQLLENLFQVLAKENDEEGLTLLHGVFELFSNELAENWD